MELKDDVKQGMKMKFQELKRVAEVGQNDEPFRTAIVCLDKTLYNTYFKYILNSVGVIHYPCFKASVTQTLFASLLQTSIHRSFHRYHIHIVKLLLPNCLPQLSERDIINATAKSYTFGYSKLIIPLIYCH